MNAIADELYCLLVPLGQERLIVPRSCVAEVVTWQEPEAVDNAPPWYLGNLSWNGRMVPVVSFEAACGQVMPPPGGRTRIVMCMALAGKLTCGYYGIVTQGFPQLVRVSGDIVKSDPNQPYFDRQPVLAQVRMINETPWIPDFEQIEHLLSEEMRG